MSKKIEEMKLADLMELYTATKLLSEKYGNELTTYAQVSQDSSFNNITSTERNLFKKHQDLTNLNEKINNRIQNIVDEYISENL